MDAGVVFLPPLPVVPLSSKPRRSSTGWKSRRRSAARPRRPARRPPAVWALPGAGFDFLFCLRRIVVRIVGRRSPVVWLPPFSSWICAVAEALPWAKSAGLENAAATSPASVVNRRRTSHGFQANRPRAAAGVAADSNSLADDRCTERSFTLRSTPFQSGRGLWRGVASPSEGPPSCHLRIQIYERLNRR